MEEQQPVRISTGGRAIGVPTASNMCASRLISATTLRGSSSPGHAAHPAPVITRRRRAIATALGEFTAGHPTRTRLGSAFHQHQPPPGRTHQTQTATGIQRPGRPPRAHMRPPIPPAAEHQQKVRELVQFEP
jgi:hypothetical protein